MGLLVRVRPEALLIALFSPTWSMADAGNLPVSGSRHSGAGGDLQQEEASKITQHTSLDPVSYRLIRATEIASGRYGWCGC